MSGAKSGHELVTAQRDDLSDLDPATILRCIDAVGARAEQLKHKGLSSKSFFFGVTNLLIVTWFFGVYPQHFWIVYVLETLILFPIRWKHMASARPLSEVLYWLDFCWIANFTCNLFLVFYLIDDYFDLGWLSTMSTDYVREKLFCAFFAVGNGPLLMAVGALGNALIFHDPNNTVSVFIHLCPSLLTFTMRWQSELIREAWPGVFKLDYFDSVDPVLDLYVWGVASYVIWFVMYCLWLFTCGWSKPGKGYDTIFHFQMRSSNPVSKLLGWTEAEVKRRALNNDFTVCSGVLYMCFHALAVCLAMLVAVLCWVSRYVHGGLCILFGLTAIYRGSARYSFYMTDSYTSLLRKEFGPSLTKAFEDP